MKINGKVHCFFEQSGTFKNEFKKLGYEAEDYDIQNHFGETDHQIDLFAEIESAYEGKPSVFDTIRGGQDNDLILAFFPCIYFESAQQMYFALCNMNQRKMSMAERCVNAIERLHKRTYFHEVLYKFAKVCYERNFQMILENPCSPVNYLVTGQNFVTPSVIDKNRRLRGDYFIKPTAYWFLNCEPTHGMSLQKPKEEKRIEHSNPSGQAGICSEERSMISPEYARNFICDFILGKEQNGTQLNLF